MHPQNCQLASPYTVHPGAVPGGYACSDFFGFRTSTPAGLAVLPPHAPPGGRPGGLGGGWLVGG